MLFELSCSKEGQMLKNDKISAFYKLVWTIKYFNQQSLINYNFSSNKLRANEFFSHQLLLLYTLLLAMTKYFKWLNYFVMVLENKF